MSNLQGHTSKVGTINVNNNNKGAKNNTDNSNTNNSANSSFLGLRHNPDRALSDSGGLQLRLQSTTNLN